MDLDSVTDELYALPRHEFIPTRDARVKEARAAGQGDLAVAIGKLRKPTSAAWLANLLAREAPAEIESLTALGDALRAAHGALDGATLQQLSRQRHEAVRALVQQARALGRAAGQPAGEAVVRELEETVTAALTDGDAAHQLAAGRLATGLSLAEHSGDWFAAEPGVTAAPSARPRTRRKDARRDRLKQDLDAARVTVAEATAARAECHRALEDAQRRSREAAEAVQELRDQLEAAERARAGAEHEVRFAHRSLDAADQHVRDTERRVRALEAELSGK